jgi:acyl-CoA dehydrogenase
MNFDFSPEEKLLQAQVRRFLEDHHPLKTSRTLLAQEGTQERVYDAPLWQGLAVLGAMGAMIPESHGGAQLGTLALCVIAEEIGRSCAALPFSSSVYLFTQALVKWGTQAQQAIYLPLLAKGELIGTFARAENNCQFYQGEVSGALAPVLDGGAAGLLLCLVQNQLLLIDLRQEACQKTPLASIDPTRKPVKITFTHAKAQILGEAKQDTTADEKIELLLNQAAIFMAFEQVGGAEAALAQARDYALTRKAFGRLIGSYQAIKHKLTDMFIAIDIARSNAYYAAMMLDNDSAELPLAASVARVAANKAYIYASEENIQTHGGIGFTWEADTQFHYRRAQLLALTLGGSMVWREKIIAELEKRNA